jgi:hypothetical protein
MATRDLRSKIMELKQSISDQDIEEPSSTKKKEPRVRLNPLIRGSRHNSSR